MVTKGELQRPVEIYSAMYFGYKYWCMACLVPACVYFCFKISAFFFYFDVICELPQLTTILSQLSFLLPHFLSISEWCESSWKLTKDGWCVTRVVTKGELGRPVERLREQKEKLQLHSAKVVMLEQQLAMAEERVRKLEGEKQADETRAERRVSTREVREIDQN